MSRTARHILIAFTAFLLIFADCGATVARTEQPTVDITAARPAIVAEAFDLADVILLDGPFKQAMERNRDYLLRLEPDKLSQNLSPTTAETCNVYNMLKLTRHLFAWQPKVAYADFYEKGLYNQILASQDPRQGMFTYYLTLTPGHGRVFSTPLDSFWCCVGTGMENHTKFGESIYFHDAGSIYVNLFNDPGAPLKGSATEVPTLAVRGRPVSEWVEAVPGEPLTFRTKGVGRPKDVTLVPFYRQYYEHSAIYWRVCPSE